MSVSLLTIYLLAGLQSVASPLPPETLHHHHKDFEAVHHEHAFHIGIFHFLGHLLEKISQQGDLTDDYLQPAILLPSYNADDDEDAPFFGSFAIPVNQENTDVNINDPPDFLPYLLLSQKANFSDHPLRAPPSFC